MNNRNNDSAYIDLITRKLSNEISPEEDQKLGMWLSESNENQQLFDSYKATWYEMDRVKGKTSKDIDSEWARLEQAIDFEGRTIRINAKFTHVYRYAAAILMIAVSAFLIYYFLSNRGTEQLVARAQIEEVKLSEGSKVTVNSNSTFTYPKKFEKDKREVELSGEAFFEVAMDPERPFIIHTGDIRVEVLGTSFNVKAYEHHRQIEVTVSSGKVAVYPQQNPDDRVVLVKGQKAIFHKSSTKIEKSLNEDINFNSWKTKVIIFEDAPMPEVIRIINEIYKSDLMLIGDRLDECPVTTTFDNQSLESVLNVLRSTLDLTIERKGDRYEISGKGC
ncbi:MAG: FecR domain-containing protein [Cytophagales bacterium]|nr:FecR domain-containing protein [Cytophagales bacterium]